MRRYDGKRQDADFPLSSHSYESFLVFFKLLDLESVLQTAVMSFTYNTILSHNGAD